MDRAGKFIAGRSRLWLKKLELGDMRFVDILGLRAVPYALQGDPLNSRKDRFFQLQMRLDRNLIRRHQYPEFQGVKLVVALSDLQSASRIHRDLVIEGKVKTTKTRKRTGTQSNQSPWFPPPL